MPIHCWWQNSMTTAQPVAVSSRQGQLCLVHWLSIHCSLMSMHFLSTEYTTGLLEHSNCSFWRSSTQKSGFVFRKSHCTQYTHTAILLSDSIIFFYFIYNSQLHPKHQNNVLKCLHITSVPTRIPAEAMDQVTLPHIQSTIALYTELGSMQKLATSTVVAKCLLVCADEHDKFIAQMVVYHCR